MSTKLFNNTDNPLFNKFSGIAHNMAHFDMLRAVVGYDCFSNYGPNSIFFTLYYYDETYQNSGRFIVGSKEFFYFFE